MNWVILDTNIYIGHWEQGLHSEALAEIQRAYVVRHSAVVLSELRRGARTKAAQKLVDLLSRRATVQWVPTASDWCEAGRWVREIGDAQGWETSKRREVQNDVLIALTAAQHGATVATANHTDFKLLQRRLGLKVLFV